MLFSFITPIPQLRAYAGSSPYHLILQHLVSDPTYASFYKEREQAGDFIILDNSIIEQGFASPLEAIDKAAQTIIPDEIVLGESWKDSEGTIRAVENGISFAQSHGWKCRLMAVIQGHDLSDWLHCFERLLNYPEVQTFGIPRLLEDYHPNGRLGVLGILEEHYKEQLQGKELHLLGLGGNPLEIKKAASMDLPIRGSDSSVPVWFGILGLPFDRSLGFPCRRTYFPPVDFYCADTKNDAVVRHNIEIVNEWCGR